MGYSSDAYNFALLPVVRSADPLWDRPDELLVATGFRVDQREVVVTTLTDAVPQARETSEGNSIWPFWTAIATSIMLIASIFTPWAVVWGSIPIAVAVIGWFWPKGVPEDDS